MVSINYTCDARGKKYTYIYDKIGRMTERMNVLNEDEITVWDYDDAGRLGLLAAVKDTKSGHKKEYYYGEFNRLAHIDEIILDELYTTGFAYDIFGRQKSLTYPGGLIIDNIYNTVTGNLKKIVRQHDNMTIWEGIDYNKHSQLTFSIKGGIRQRMEYYPETGYLLSSTASDIQSFEYHYDALGNMDHRYDHLHKVNGQSLHEQFYYDRRNQLTGTYLNGTLASHIIYDNLGNITSKTATGGFEYQSGNSPYQLTSIVPDQNIDPGYKLSQNITYTDFNKVGSITGGGYKLEIEHGLENQRISQSLHSVNQHGQTTLLLKKHFTGGLQEKIFYETGAEKTISYISSPEGLTAIEVKSGTTSGWYTVLTDHLGSITTLVRESDGSRFELGYDAWGNRRDPATWASYSGNLPDFITITDPAFITDRGFTGHEHLDMFGLINMNGRVYDPVASRFLSPDSFIQAPGLALNYNGYVYCLNNPLKYTDPDGEFFWLAVAVTGFIFSTDPGYQLQKYISPVAFKIDIKTGTHQKGLGYDVSIGVPKTFPYAKRWERGDTYFWKSYGNYCGWEARTGTETSYLGIYTKSTTHYKAGEFTQTVGRMSFGIPSVAGVDVSNDLFGDKGDRFRTSHVRINLGIARVGNTLFTGDPGLRDRNVKKDIKGHPTYAEGPYGEDPDKYRNGILYIGLGPIEIGWDSEAIRNRIQNHWIHQNLNPPSPFFRDLRGTDEYEGDRFYFQFGWGGMW